MPITSPSPNDLTRQQLDELDALLQRMLSLPMSGPAPDAAAAVSAVRQIPAPPLPDTGPAVTATGWRADPPVPGAKTPHLTPEPAPVVRLPQSPPALPAAPAGHPAVVEMARLFGPPAADTGVPPSAGASDHEARSATLRGVDAPAVPHGFRSAFAPMSPADVDEPHADAAPVALEPAPVVVADNTAPSAGRVPVVMWPLFATNWVLEAVLGLLGPFGAVFTYPAMKHVWGVTGILLVAAAAAWTAQGLGWIALPIPR